MEKHTYRVKPGYTFGPASIMGPGELVELTEYEANGFLDKLELVQEPASPVEPVADPEPITVEVPAPDLIETVDQEQLETAEPTVQVEEIEVEAVPQWKAPKRRGGKG
jgi:hypothetical protein